MQRNDVSDNTGIHPPGIQHLGREPSHSWTHALLYLYSKTGPVVMCRNFVLRDDYARGIISSISTFYNNVVKMGICSRTPRTFEVVIMLVQKWFNRYVYKMVQYSDFSNYVKKDMLNIVTMRIRGVVVWLKYVSPFSYESAKFFLSDDNFPGSRNKLAY